mmetsp:Transcript_21927/g.68651  ORF Transcript_21927/g.68651 Transcript_21927/m.68651 type:complete len:135 (-) Transcript_21927:190-594(-)
MRAAGAGARDALDVALVEGVRVGGLRGRASVALAFCRVLLEGDGEDAPTGQDREVLDAVRAGIDPTPLLGIPVLRPWSLAPPPPGQTSPPRPAAAPEDVDVHVGTPQSTAPTPGGDGTWTPAERIRWYGANTPM